MIGALSGRRKSRIGVARVQALDVRSSARDYQHQRQPVVRCLTIACQTQVLGPPDSRLGVARTRGKVVLRSRKDLSQRRLRSRSRPEARLLSTVPHGLAIGNTLGKTIGRRGVASTLAMGARQRRNPLHQQPSPPQLQR